MKIVYIAHPIAGDVKENVKKIIKIVREVNLRTPLVVPFVPYLADVLALDDDNARERARGLENGITVLKSGVVDELWIYGDRVTAGMKSEIDMAADIGLTLVRMDRETDMTGCEGHIFEEGYNN